MNISSRAARATFRCRPCLQIQFFFYILLKIHKFLNHPVTRTTPQESAVTRRFCLALCVCFCLSGCLVPDQYNATLSLSNAAYSVEFIGKIHMAASYSETYKRGADNPQQLADAIMKEFSRVIKERPQSNVEIRPLDEHSFAAKYLYVSSYSLQEATGMFVFTVDGDTLTVISRPIASKDMQFLNDNNITSKGTLCIKAFGTVLESNADKQATLLNRCNEWQLTDLERPVKLVVRFPRHIPAHPSQGMPPAPGQTPAPPGGR